MDLATGLILRLLLPSLTWSFSQMWNGELIRRACLWPRTPSNLLRQILIQFSSSTSQSALIRTCLLSCAPLSDWHREPRPTSGTRTQEDKEPPAFIWWLGPCLICLCHPHDKTQKAFALKGFTSPSHPNHEPHQSNLPQFPFFNECTFRNSMKNKKIAFL